MFFNHFSQQGSILARTGAFIPDDFIITNLTWSNGKCETFLVMALYTDLRIDMAIFVFGEDNSKGTIYFEFESN